MAVLRSTPSVSRRTALTVFGAAGLGLSLGSLAHQALAQDASPEVPRISRVDHPVFGTWEWTNDLQQEADSRPTPIIFARDGTCLEFDPVFGVGIGYWGTIDAQRADIMMQYQTLAGPWLNLQGPIAFFDADYVPAPTTFGQGFIVTRSTLVVEDTVD
jgi:hypothetical protein